MGHLQGNNIFYLLAEEILISNVKLIMMMSVRTKMYVSYCQQRDQMEKSLRQVRMQSSHWEHLWVGRTPPSALELETPSTIYPNTQSIND